MAIEILTHTAIEASLKINKRQYLLGTLTKPQDLKEIVDANVEAGITKYREPETEIPHYHTTCTEYQYVLSGKAEYMDLDTNCVYAVSQGDFFVIRPMTKYYQKACAGTEILFFKVPGGNDKQETSLNREQEEWGTVYDF